MKDLYISVILIVRFALGPSLVFLAGRNCRRHQFPWMAGIVAIGPHGTLLCTGTLISSRAVLTAAHCVKGFGRFNISLGDVDIYNKTDQGQLLVSSKADFHDEWNATGMFENDIAIIKLPDSVPESESIKYARLPTSEMTSDTFEGQYATIAGFGTTFDVGIPSDGQCHWADERRIMANAECRKGWLQGHLAYELEGMIAPVLDEELDDAPLNRRLNKKLKLSVAQGLLRMRGFFGEERAVGEGSICIDTKDGPGGCSGDSGSSLILQSGDGCQYHVGVAGLVGEQGCRDGSPHVFARTTHYLDWIQEHAREPDANGNSAPALTGPLLPLLASFAIIFTC